MEEARRRGRFRSFLLGGIVGGAAALVASHRKRPPRRRTPVGLAAFEDAPCYEETLVRERTIRRT
jgi:hypothetical protein